MSTVRFKVWENILCFLILHFSRLFQRNVVRQDEAPPTAVENTQLVCQRLTL